MTKIILVRHGQTTWNVERKYQGHTDVELSDVGLSQAELAGKRFANEQIDAVYASDLTRAFTTAQAIAKHHNLTVSPVPELRELNFGEWEGLPFDVINSQWAELMDKLFTHPDEVRIPGGETFSELKERSMAAIARLAANHPNETILIVSHGATIRTILCAVLNIHLNHVWNIRQENTAVNVIEYYDDSSMIVSLVNDAHHLQ